MPASDILHRFGEVPFPVEVELGSLTMTLGEVLEIKAGTIIRTGHSAGDPLAVCVGDIQLAEADPVVIEDSMSARIKRLSQNAKSSGDGDGSK